jgi:hypothetical protein
MPRKATDLLDVFRHQRAEPARGAPREPKAAPREAAPRGAGFQGLVLLPRHVKLGAAVGVLLLVFAFVLGLSLGRPEKARATRDGAALSAVTARDTDPTRRIYVEARVPYMDPVRKTVNDPAHLRRTLAAQKGIPEAQVWLTDDLAAVQLRILVGPFPNQAQAADFLLRRGFFTLRLGGVLPWKDPEYLELSERELPPTHLPSR